MFPLQDRDDHQTLSDALRIAERAFRIAVISGDDPFAAVAQAAAYLQLEGSRAHERVLEELSDAGTAAGGSAALHKFLLEAIAELRKCLFPEN